MKEEQHWHSCNSGFWWHLLSSCYTFTYKKINSSHRYHTASNFSEYCRVATETYIMFHLPLTDAAASYSLKRRKIFKKYIINLKQQKHADMYGKIKGQVKNLGRLHISTLNRSCTNCTMFPNLGSHSIASGGTPVLPSFPKMCPTPSAYFHCWLWQNASYSIHPFLRKIFPFKLFVCCSPVTASVMNPLFSN